MRRSNVVCADSPMNFRCPGRRPATAPYIEPAATTTDVVPAPARATVAISSSDSSSDSDKDEIYAFVDVDKCNSAGVE